MNPLERFAIGLKQFRMAWAVAPRWSWWGNNSTRNIDFRGEIGDGRNTAIVQDCVLWICRNFPEAPVRVSTLDRKGDPTPQPNHPLKQLLDEPNEFYSGEELWWATIADWVFGNAYWLKVRSGAGRPVQLWWIPSNLMEPKWPDDGSQFISHYEYKPNADVINIPVKDVVHFRHGLDPNNPRKGLSTISALLREIFTDEEAAAYTATVLRNVGVPPVIISPGPDVRPTTEELEEVKSSFIAKTTGRHRGEPMVMRAETNVKVLGFSPTEMNLRDLRGIPEERISAAFGIPAAVVGLGSGLANSKVGATMSEFREQAYENMIIPSQRLLASTLRSQLLKDFGDVSRLKIDFDLTQVRVLQDDQNDLMKRMVLAVGGPIMTPNEARQVVGLDAIPEGDVLFLPNTVTPTELDALIPEPVEPATVVTEIQPGETQPALPAPAKQLRVLKSSKPTDATERLVTRLEESGTPEVAKFLSGQLGRVVERLQSKPKAADVPDADNLLPLAEEALLLEVLSVVHRRGLQGAHLLAEDLLGVSISLEATLTRRFLTEVGGSVKGITNTTRFAIRDAIQDGLAEGETVAQIADRLKGLPEFTEARARMVARTEAASVVNKATLLVYEVSGVVVGVRVSDGDQDSGCAAVNGRTFRLTEAPALLEHPNCRRQFHPITDPRELENVA